MDLFYARAELAAPIPPSDILNKAWITLHHQMKEFLKS